jgi:carboxypeptidase C (cathepsin A)
MYYQLFSALGCDIMKEDPRIPLIIWLQGGPGGSSQFGLFTENGPIRIVDGKAKLFSYSWSNQGHMIFIDQPLNVGFSYYGNRTGKAQVSSANEAAEHLLNFLSNFYREWPMLRSSPLIITG